jgi:hypothetical protein
MSGQLTKQEVQQILALLDDFSISRAEAYLIVNTIQSIVNRAIARILEGGSE